MRAEFAVRLREAFDGASNAEIARRLSANDSTIKFYTDATRLPIYEMLVEISRVTGCNLNWLMTGRGPRRIEKPTAMFTEAEENEIRELAVKAGRSFEDQVRVLAMAAVELAAKL